MVREDRQQGGSIVNQISGAKRKARLGEFLLAKGIITEDQLQASLERQKLQGGFLGEALVGEGVISPTMLGSYMEELTTFPYVELSSFPINGALARGVTEQFARQHLVIPFAEWDQAIQVAMVNPQNLAVVDGLRDRLNRRIVPFFAFKSDVLDAINRVYDVQQKGHAALAEIEPEATSEEGLSANELEHMAEQAPIVRLSGYADILDDRSGCRAPGRVAADGVLPDPRRAAAHDPDHRRLAARAARIDSGLVARGSVQRPGRWRFG